MRSSFTATPPVAARQVPTKLTKAPASSRPVVNDATSAWGSKTWSVMRTSTLAPAHGRQEGDFIAIGYRLGQVMRHALIDDQSRPRSIHGRTKQRLLVRDPFFEVRKRAHAARQRDLGQRGRRHVAKLAQ